jgi:hypothetical protein
VQKSEEKEGVAMFTCPYDAGTFNEALGILICRPTGELTADFAHDFAICRECIVKAGLEQVNRFHDLTGITATNLRYEEVVPPAVDWTGV